MMVAHSRGCCGRYFDDEVELLDAHKTELEEADCFEDDIE